MNAKYVVASKKNRTTRSFNEASDVAAFMWGRIVSDWTVYQRQDDLPADVGAMEKLLLAREGVAPVFSPKAK
jgi:hypothetical protein